MPCAGAQIPGGGLTLNESTKEVPMAYRTSRLKLWLLAGLVVGLLLGISSGPSFAQ